MGKKQFILASLLVLIAASALLPAQDPSLEPMSSAFRAGYDQDYPRYDQDGRP